MNSFLDRVAHTFVSEVGDCLSSYTFVFPNRRAGLFFRKYLAAHLTKPLFSPSVITINECFTSLSRLHVADPLTLLIRLYRLYRQEHPDAEPIEQFLHWGQMMLSDFSEVDNHLVPDVQALFTAVSDLKTIDVRFAALTKEQRDAIKLFWGSYLTSAQHHNTSDSLHSQFLTTWQLLWPLYEALRNDLLTDGLAWDGMLHRDVIEHLDTLPDESLSEHYVFIGFNAMTRSEEQLMLWLQSMGKADFYFDYTSTYLTDPDNRASLFYEHNRQLFHSHYPIPTIAQGEPELNLVTVPGTIAQTHEVHRILSQLYANAKPDTDFTKTAVVLPDEQLLIPLLDAFPPVITKINATMGFPLRATSLYPLIAYPDQYLPDVDTAEDYMEGLNHLLTERKNESNAEVIFQLQQVLDHLTDAMTRYPGIVVSAKAAAEIVRMLTLDAAIPFAGEPLNGLQVMGVLETRALDFDNLIITSFNDDIYPGHTRQNSFIPYSLRRAFSLPTIERQDAIFAYNFYRMLSYARRVWFITNTSTDGMQSGEPSRYLYQLQLQYHLSVHRYTVLNTPKVRLPQHHDIPKTSAMLSELRQHINQGLSASAINQYLKCEKQFYYAHVLNIPQPEPDDSICISAATIGTVVHDIIKGIYGDYVNQTITDATIDTIRQSLTQKRWVSFPKWSLLQNDILAQEVVKSYVRLILEYDLTQVPFICLNLEKHVHHTISIPEIGTILLQGNIDRIDQRGDIVRIVDYKTGDATMKFKNVTSLFTLFDEDPKGSSHNDAALQTLFYCMLVWEKIPSGTLVQPHLYTLRSISAADFNSLMYPKEATNTFNYALVADEYRQGLQHLLRELFDSNIPFRSTGIHRDKVCDQCPYQTLCREYSSSN